MLRRFMCWIDAHAWESRPKLYGGFEINYDTRVYCGEVHDKHFR